MNSIQLKIKLATITPQTLESETLKISGNCQFMYKEKGTYHVQTLAYSAIGKVAEYLQQEGTNSIHAIVGSLDIYPPNDTNRNHNAVVFVKQALLCLSAT